MASPSKPIANLIDLSSDDEGPETAGVPSFRRANTDTKIGTEGHRLSTASTKSPPPMPPKKPVALRSSSGDSLTSASPAAGSKAPPPPRPRRPSSTVHQSSPLTQQLSNPSSKPQPGPKPPLQSEQSWSGWGREKLNSAYNQLPSTSSYLHSDKSESKPSQTSTGAETAPSAKRAPPPPPPRRERGITTYPAAAASYVGTKASSAWQHAPSVPHPSTRPGNAPYSTTTGLQRSNTASTLGTIGGGNGNGEYPPEMSKREVLWRQRWARAEQVLGEKGVVLRSWRVGTDCLKEAEELVKKAVNKENKEGKGKGEGNGASNGNRNGNGRSQ